MGELKRGSLGDDKRIEGIEKGTARHGSHTGLPRMVVGRGVRGQMDRDYFARSSSFRPPVSRL